MWGRDNVALSGQSQIEAQNDKLRGFQDAQNRAN